MFNAKRKTRKSNDRGTHSSTFAKNALGAIRATASMRALSVTESVLLLIFLGLTAAAVAVASTSSAAAAFAGGVTANATARV